MPRTPRTNQWREGENKELLSSQEPGRLILADVQGHHHSLPAASPIITLFPRAQGPHSPPVEGSRSKDRDKDPLEEKAESTEDTPDSRLPLSADGSLDSEELRLSSSGPSSIWEMPESSWDSSSERVQLLSKAGAEARLRGVDTGACEDRTGRWMRLRPPPQGGGRGGEGKMQSWFVTLERNACCHTHGTLEPNDTALAHWVGRPGKERLA